MSRTRTPQPTQYKTVELTNDFKQDAPVGWLVENATWEGCDYRLFAELEAAEGHAEMQKDITESDDDWPIYPLYASHAVANVREPRRDV